MLESDYIRWWIGYIHRSYAIAILIALYSYTMKLTQIIKKPYLHEAPAGLEFGSGLGQWEDEFDGKDYIE